MAMKSKLSFLLSVLVLVVGCGGPGSGPGVLEMGETWLATYLGDEKIGYSVSRYDKYADGYRFDNLIKMKIAMAGITQEIRSRSVVVTGPDLTLQSLKFSFESQNRSLKATGTVKGNELVIQAGEDKPRVIRLEGPVYPMAALGKLVKGHKPKSESTFRLKVFDATVMSVVPVEVTILGQEKLTIGDKVYDALKVETRMARFTVTSWLDRNGMTLAEKSPPKMRSERTSPERAMAGESGKARLDLLKMFRVQVDTVVREPARVHRAKLEISGVRPGDFEFASVNQRVLSKKPLQLEVLVPKPGSSPIPLPIKTEQAFLEPSFAIQCDNPEIQAKMHEALGEPKEAVSAARKLVSWVFTVLEKEPTASFPSALDVLKHMKGDCNEHAVFYAALARAAGIPTKVAVGLVYMNGAFYYHAWNEVFLGKWIPVDATFGEFPASALHLKLSEGELREQAQILAVVGRIGIRILEFE